MHAPRSCTGTATRQSPAHNAAPARDPHESAAGQRGATVIEYVFVAMLISIAATLTLTNIGKKPANMLAPAISAMEGSPP